MEQSKLDLKVVMEETNGKEHRIYRYAHSPKALHRSSVVMANSAVADHIPERQELTLLEQEQPKAWEFYNYFHVKNFLYTNVGVVVAGIVSLKEKADSIRILIEVFDKHTHEILDSKEMGTESVFNYDFEGIFQIADREPESLLTAVTATWEQAGKTETLTEIQERCIRKQIQRNSSSPVDTYTQIQRNSPHPVDKYTHIYPKKEQSPVIIGNPEIHRGPDGGSRAPQKDIVVALYRLPEHRTDCDYIIGFGTDSHGYPYLCVPAKGILTLKENQKFVEEPFSAQCILTRCDDGGGATLLGGTGHNPFGNTKFKYSFNREKTEMTYDWEEKWKDVFDYAPDLNIGYRFDYSLMMGFDYAEGRTAKYGTLDVSSSNPFADCCIPYIRIIYGCLSKDSMILMADGCYRRIDSLKIGDMIRAGKCGDDFNVVENIWRGEERTLYKIQTRTHCISASNSHPILTTKGVVKAGCLEIDMEVCCLGGSIEKIISIDQIDYNDVVYNLDLQIKTNSFFISNGVVVGDMRLQNMIPSSQE